MLSHHMGNHNDRWVNSTTEIRGSTVNNTYIYAWITPDTPIAYTNHPNHKWTCTYSTIITNNTTLKTQRATKHETPINNPISHFRPSRPSHQTGQKAESPQSAAARWGWRETTSNGVHIAAAATPQRRVQWEQVPDREEEAGVGTSAWTQRITD